MTMRLVMMMIVVVVVEMNFFFSCLMAHLCGRMRNIEGCVSIQEESYAQIVRPAEQLLGIRFGDGGGGIFADSDGRFGLMLWLMTAPSLV